ncbi:MAG: endolytic transglycosylase MltG [Actinobacteria bacterium]|nr:endolytic transglycosylase MltG [Actinomycetota bacterium]
MSYYDEYPEPEPRRRWVPVVKWTAVAALLVGSLVLGVAGMKVLAGYVGDLIGTDQTTVVAGEPVQVEVLPGSSARQIGDLLVEAGVVSSAGEFDRYVRDTGVSNRLQAGLYELTTGMEVADVVAVLTEGPDTGDVYRLTVIEGLTAVQTLQSIARQTDFTVLELEQTLLGGDVTTALLPPGVPGLTAWEGLLFPDTYEFADDATADEVLQVLADTAEQRVASIDWSMLEARGLTPYEGMVIASMIEREALLDEERPLISSVVFNRLDEGMLLQIDATVVYAVGGTTALTFEDLEVDSPYNTYRYPGLPPTPIAGVRLASLAAAAAPADTDYLYYVLTGEDGSHSFTDDFDEFLRLQEQARIDGVIP